MWVESQPQQRKPTLLLRAYIPQSNVGQVAHVSPTLWVASQEADIKGWTLEAACGSGWGVGATALRTATLALVHSTAEYCAPVWCRSAHTRLIHPATNDTLRTVTGWLRPIPADNLPMLAGIQPAELRRKGATPPLARRPMEPGHLGGNAWHLKSRRPECPLHNNSSVHLTTVTAVRPSGRMTDGIRID